MRPLLAVEAEVLQLLRDAGGSVKLTALQKSSWLGAIELKAALDALQIRDLVERIDTGREVVYAALAAPAAATLQAAAIAAAPAAPAAASLARSVPAGSSACQENQKRIVAYLGTQPGYGAIGRQIFDALNITQSAFSQAVLKLCFADQVVRRGSAGVPLYCLSPKAVEALGLSATGEAAAAGTSTSEFPPALATPAVQPIDTATSTAVPAAQTDLPRAVTEPAGSRHELSDSDADVDPDSFFEADIDPLLAWHADRADKEAARREQQRQCPAAPFLALPDAMRNTGQAIPCSIGEIAEFDVATSLQIDSASYALWSDGRLEIDAGDQHIALSSSATRALIDYLDRVCAIELH